jgi:hypothetical protein
MLMEIVAIVFVVAVTTMTTTIGRNQEERKKSTVDRV